MNLREIPAQFTKNLWDPVGEGMGSLQLQFFCKVIML